MKHHTPALRYNCLEGTEVTSTLISWPSWPCLNSGEQASGAFLCAQKESKEGLEFFPNMTLENRISKSRENPLQLIAANTVKYVK